MRVKLPKVVYVAARSEDGTSWLEADSSIDGFEHGDLVGVYKLDELLIKRVSHILSDSLEKKV